MGKGVTVLTTQDFEEYQDRIEQRLLIIESELAMYRSVLPQWISRTEAMEFLGVGSSKLHELRKQGKITVSSATGFPKFYIPSLRDYMISQSVDSKGINEKLKIIFQKRLH